MNRASEDLPKIGPMVLGGRWEGQQIVPEEWIAESTSAQVESDARGPQGPHPYGHFWWVVPGVGLSAWGGAVRSS